MKIIELCSKSKNSGKKFLRAILFKIQPDSCLENLTGTKYNLNGITWIKQYCETALPSIIGRSVTVEFLDESRTEILGHGNTGVSDGIPVFDNATSIGHFTNAYIDNMEVDGEMCTVAIGEAELDYMRYKPFLDLLEDKLSQGETVYGSVEILGTPDNNNEIIYLDGWKKEGRVPTEFLVSGWAILSIKPSDSKSQILELNQLNNKKEDTQLDEKLLKQMFDSQRDAIINKISEINECKKEENSKVKELNDDIKTKDEKITELNASVESLTQALEDVKKERQEAWDKLDVLYEEEKQLKGKIAESEVKEKIGELNSVISTFTDDEKEYAKSEIETFNADPIKSEINSVVSKIWEGIGKKAKENEGKESARRIAEQNSAKNDMNDIFGDVGMRSTSIKDDVNIFA